jgi:branched-chain amino acid transport system substrate-binding protein
MDRSIDSGLKGWLLVMTDIAGPTALANSKGSVIAAEMAAEGFGAGLNVEVISADHSGKPDTGSQIAARWFDSKVSTQSPTCRIRPLGLKINARA